MSLGLPLIGLTYLQIRTSCCWAGHDSDEVVPSLLLKLLYRQNFGNNCFRDGQRSACLEIVQVAQLVRSWENGGPNYDHDASDRFTAECSGGARVPQLRDHKTSSSNLRASLTCTCITASAFGCLKQGCFYVTDLPTFPETSYTFPKLGIIMTHY